MFISKFYKKIYKDCDDISLLTKRKNEEIKILLLELLRDFVATSCCIFLYCKDVLYAMPILFFGLGFFIAGTILFIIKFVINMCQFSKRLKEIQQY